MPSGWWRAPRPSTRPAQRATSSRAVPWGPGRPGCVCGAAAVGGQDGECARSQVGGGQAGLSRLGGRESGAVISADQDRAGALQRETPVQRHTERGLHDADFTAGTWTGHTVLPGSEGVPAERNQPAPGVRPVGAREGPGGGAGPVWPERYWVSAEDWPERGTVRARVRPRAGSGSWRSATAPSRRVTPSSTARWTSAAPTASDRRPAARPGPRRGDTAQQGPALLRGASTPGKKLLRGFFSLSGGVTPSGGRSPRPP